MCTDQISDRRLVSKSSWARMSALAAWRFWLTITKVERKIASRLTIIVSSPKGNLSNLNDAPSIPTFTSTQIPNQTEWM